MADEATLRVSLAIVKKSSDGSIVLIDFQSRPTSFRADVTGTKGPTPGAIAVPTTGVNVDLSELTTPGLCWIKNDDDTNYVEWGVWDGEFHPLGELLPGECFPLRLSRNLGSEFGTGTGTSGSGNSLRLKANTAACVCTVFAFEK